MSTNTKPITPDTNPHIVSTVTKSGNSFTNSSSSFWILDTRASDHVCPHVHLFSTCHSISSISIKLPNGAMTIARFLGTISLTPTLCLYSVLLSPEFQFNLIPVNKLTHSFNCKLIFSPFSCDIQDMSTQKMIGHAEVHNHLYILHQPTSNGFLKSNLEQSSLFLL